MEFNSIFKPMIAAGIVASLLVVACETKNKMDSAEIADEKNEAKFDGAQENGADFILELSKANLSEIRTAQLGAKMAQSPEVKEFASNMIDQHKKMYGDNVIYAAANNISIPDTIAKGDISEYDNLTEKTGVDFDVKFVDVMVDDHKRLIDKLERASKNEKYTQEIKSMSAQALPLVRPHYQRAVELQDNLKKK
ncbi:MAG: DUF4142 domain-containing protein [Cytophagales bacterium]